MSAFDLQSLFKVTEVELIYRNQVDHQDMPKVTAATDAYLIFKASWDENRIELLEQFKIILLNRGNRCLGISDIATGGTDTCLVDPKIVFGTALKTKAAALILAHNHPSGNPDFSQADIDITKKLISGGKLLDLQILDHLVLTRHGFSSMADMGLMP